VLLAFGPAAVLVLPAMTRLSDGVAAKVLSGSWFLRLHGFVHCSIVFQVKKRVNSA
jgi:hypothetical protein